MAKRVHGGTSPWCSNSTTGPSLPPSTLLPTFSLSPSSRHATTAATRVEPGSEGGAGSNSFDSDFYVNYIVSPFPGGGLEPPPELFVSRDKSPFSDFPAESVLSGGRVAMLQGYESRSDSRSGGVTPASESAIQPVQTQAKSKSAPLDPPPKPPIFPSNFRKSEPLLRDFVLRSLRNEREVNGEEEEENAALMGEEEETSSSYSPFMELADLFPLRIPHSSRFNNDLEVVHESELDSDSDTVTSPSRSRLRKKKKRSKYFGCCSPCFCVPSQSLPTSPVRDRTPGLLGSSGLLGVDVHSRDLFSLSIDHLHEGFEDQSDHSEYVLEFEKTSQSEDVEARLLNSSFRSKQQKYLHGWGAGILISSAARLGKLPKLLPYKPDRLTAQDRQNASSRSSFELAGGLLSMRGSWERLENEERESHGNQMVEARRGTGDDGGKEIRETRESEKGKRGKDLKEEGMDKSPLAHDHPPNENKVSLKNPLFSNKKIMVSSKFFGRKSLSNSPLKTTDNLGQGPSEIQHQTRDHYTSFLSSTSSFQDSNSETSSKNAKDQTTRNSRKAFAGEEAREDSVNIDKYVGIHPTSIDEKNHKHQGEHAGELAAENPNPPLTRRHSDPSTSNHSDDSHRYSMQDLTPSGLNFSGQITEPLSSVDSQSQALEILEYGPIGYARVNSLNSDHWMWLFMNYLEILVNKLSENESALDATSSSTFVFPSPNTKFSCSNRLTDYSLRSVNTFEMDFRLLESKFKGVESSIKKLSFTSLLEVLTVGLSVWLKFWDLWGVETAHTQNNSSGYTFTDKDMGKGPEGSQQDTSKETLSESEYTAKKLEKNKKNRRKKAMSDSSVDTFGVDRDELASITPLQSQFLSEIMGKINPEIGITQFEILKYTSLACTIESHRPATAIFLLLQLLDRIGLRETVGELDQNHSFGESESEIRRDVSYYRAFGHFVVSCLNSILSTCAIVSNPYSSHYAPPTSPSIKSSSSDETVMWEVPKLSLLAETSLGKALASAQNISLLRRSDEMDRLHRCFQLSPSFIGICLAVEVQRMPFLCCDDVMSLAIHLEEIGCEEASFHAALRAVSSGRLDSSGFDHVIQMCFYGRGIKTAHIRFSKLLAIIKSAQFSLSEAYSFSYIGEFLSALLRVTGAEKKFPWAFSSALHFARLHSNGNENSDLIHRLSAIVTLHRWMSMQTEEEKQKGRILVLERMSDPERDVSWPVWMAIAKILEERYHMAQAVCTMRAKVICSISKKIECNGLSKDPIALSTFDWAIEGLLNSVTQKEGASGFVSLLSPSRCENLVDVILAVAARIAATDYLHWSISNQKAVFIAQLLSWVYENDLEIDQRRFAVAIGVHVWGWALPNPAQLLAKSSSKEESEYVLERAAVTMWNSVVAAGFSPEVEARNR